ncbi:MAG: QacE family quaternary ammonium compound efflux SMR transporter [Rhodobacteraceae bacterium]|nr:QacE family quaternary ammonium compound efflux SMR transporter [Paracoccaceae bacterium]
MHWLLLAVAILFETIATASLKASHGFTRLGPTALSLGAYAVAFWFLAMVLKVVPVGVAYAIWSGAGICLIAMIAALFFGQRLDPPALVGMALIVAGILVINLFSGAAPH